MQTLQERHTKADLLTAEQVEYLLEVDKSTVYRMAEDGRLPAIKVGRQWRFPAERIAALLHSDLVPDAPSAQSASDARGIQGEHAGPAASAGAVGLHPDQGFVQAAEAVLTVAADLLGV